ncbi:MAG: hypothetical protein MJ215_07550, partial [Spirochaetia bacterium]|nr:hypothetical protein [Spirochaetia bacterium]
MKQLYDDVYNSYRSMILSASGWRKVFAADGDDNSMGTELTGADQLLSAAIGTVFASWAISRGCRTIAAGRDARPTGKAITEIIIRAALEAGLRVQYLSVCAAPEIMAYVKQTADLDGFIYISASHNPAGHNGVKFGLGNGAVIGGQDSAEIISMFREFMENRENYPALDKLSSTALEIPASEATKQEALDIYMNFNLTTAFPDSTLLEKFRRIRKPAVIADMNGSARTLSIDHQFFTTLGIEHAFINNKPGAIAHGILPEGKNLDWAASFLEKKFREDSSFTMGYMPDNDGDRGNLVFIDSHTGKAIIPDAQTVFALACAAELSFMEYSGMIVPGK